MTTLEDYLKQNYFEPGNPAFFTSAKRLWQISKKQGYSAPLSFYRDWIQSQEAASLHKPVLRKFRTKRIVVSTVNKVWEADLIQMDRYSNSNQGVNFILLAIDAMSRYVRVHTLKTKQSKEVKEALERLMQKSKPKILTTDAGGEFCNRIVEAFLKKHGIYHKITRNFPKAAIAERANKSIKQLITKYLTHNNTFEYLDVLQDIVTGYNKTIHSSTGVAPAKMTKSLAKKLWWHIYKPKLNFKLIPYKFRVGDKVRLSYLKSTFQREYDERWTGEIFTIISRFKRDGLPFYQVKDYNNDVIKGWFYTQELQRVIMSDEDKVWKIDKILKTRTQ